MIQNPRTALKHSPTRRDVLRAAATAGAAIWLCPLASGHVSAATEPSLYDRLLKDWCDRLLQLQVTAPRDASRDGLLSCPACAFVHGRCADAIHPLLHMARSTGDHRYVDAAVRLQRWSDNVSEPDGAFRNDVEPGTWKGITVFAAIALAEALHHHGELLDPPVRATWRDRLARAARFLDGFLTMQTGNINYPVTAALAFTLIGDVLDEPRYRERGRTFAHHSLAFFTPRGLLFGEGSPQTGTTSKGCRPVDLGYNVEESLPALAQYALITRDGEVAARVVDSLRAHLEFMLPDGGWDNSWGTRQFKWTWWGSRTSDGCQPAYALMASRDARFAEAAQRNLELLAACTHDGLLHGGPHLRAQGIPPCVHHTFTHAKALATVLDRKGHVQPPSPRVSLPRDAAYGLRMFPEIGTWLAAVGDWRATFTEYDWEYKPSGGGHPSGGALSLLYHQRIGPVLVASMTEYQLWEAHNQQIQGDWPTMPLTPRIEVPGATSLSDFAGVVAAKQDGDAVVFDARGKLLTSKHDDPPGGPAHYSWRIVLTPVSVRIEARCDTAGRLVLPFVCTQSEAVERPDPRRVHVLRERGRLVVEGEGPAAFEPVPERRVFNFVPGFQCAPVVVSLAPNRAVSVTLRAEA
jgi:hypothetical protein